MGKWFFDFANHGQDFDLEDVRVTTTQFDHLNRPVKVIVPGPLLADVAVTTAYTSTGLAHEVVDELGRDTLTEYDAAGRPVKVSSPSATHYSYTGNTLGSAAARAETTNVYDADGNATEVTDPLGRKAYAEFDQRGRQTVAFAPEVNVLDEAGAPGDHWPGTVTEYDPAGNVTRAYPPRGADTADNGGVPEIPAMADHDEDYATTTYYDRANRPYLAVGPKVDHADATAEGHPATLSVFDPNGNVLQTHSGVYAAPPPAGTSPDPDDFLATEAQRQDVANTYDRLNRLLTTTTFPLPGDPLEDITVHNAYGPAGNLVEVRDGADQYTTFTYDGLNRNLTTTYGAGAANDTTTLTYNAAHQAYRLDPAGQVTAYRYDLRGRLLGVDYGDDGTDERSYTYNDAGELEAVDEAGDKADVAYTYDNLGRVLAETSGGVTHTYGYDKAGNRLLTTYGDGLGGTARQLLSTYDAHNRTLSIVQDEDADLTIETGAPDDEPETTYTYDLAGNIRQLAQANGKTVSRSYDRAGRTGDISDSTGFYSYALRYDLYGNLRSQVETYTAGDLDDRTVTLAYDGADRLVEEETETFSTPAVTTTSTYAYDKANNRTQLDVAVAGGSTTTTTYDFTGNSLNQIQGYTVTEGATTIKAVTFTYGENGNRETRAEDFEPGQGTDSTTTYQYDPENRLTGLTRTGASPGTYAYTYDYRTRRVERTEPGGNTKVVFSGGLSVQDRDATTGNLQAEYIRGSDYGGGVGGILYSIRSGDASYNHYNGRGDVVAQTDDTGSLTYQAAYEAFGSHDDADPRTQESGSSADPHRANTKEEDPTGLLNEGFRYRDLEAGVFITRDPLGFVDGPNVYSYVVQNPWSRFDPMGLATKLELRAENARLRNKIRRNSRYADRLLAKKKAMGYWHPTNRQKYFELVIGNAYLSGEIAKNNARIRRITESAKAIDFATGIDYQHVLDDKSDKHLIEAGLQLRTAMAGSEQFLKYYVGAKATGFVLGKLAKYAPKVLHGISRVFSAIRTKGAPKGTGSLLPTGICFAAGTLVLGQDGLTPIEDLQVGERVITSDSEVLKPTEVSLDSEDWRLIDLEMWNPDGSKDLIKISLLRPKTWMADYGVEDGASIYLYLDEIGLRGAATVRRVKPCPKIDGGSGRLITGTIRHLNGYLYRVKIKGLENAIEVTETHRLYSIDRDAWVQVRDLRAGESLRTADEPVVIQTISRKNGVYEVFNVEVNTDRCYFVSEKKVLSHNVNPCAARYAHYSQQSRSHVYSHGHAANSPPVIHSHTGTVVPKSKFSPTEGGQKFTLEVMNHPNVQIQPQSNGRISYTVLDLGRNVGRDRAGNLTRGGQVIVEGSNPQSWSTYVTDEVVTQYPF